MGAGVQDHEPRQRAGLPAARDPCTHRLPHVGLLGRTAGRLVSWGLGFGLEAPAHTKGRLDLRVRYEPF